MKKCIGCKDKEAEQVVDEPAVAVDMVVEQGDPVDIVDRQDSQQVVEQIVPAIDVDQLPDDVVEQIVPAIDVDQLPDDVVEQIAPAIDVDQLPDDVVEQIAPAIDVDQLPDDQVVVEELDFGDGDQLVDGEELQLVVLQQRSVLDLIAPGGGERK